MRLDRNVRFEDVELLYDKVKYVLKLICKLNVKGVDVEKSN